MYSTLVDLLSSRAAQTPDQLAYSFLTDGESVKDDYSYQRLHERASIVAARLQQDLQFGDRILLFYEPSMEYIAAFFGCMYAGMIPVPAYPPERRNLSRLISVIQDSEAAAALTTSRIYNGLEQIWIANPEARKALGSQLIWYSSDEFSPSLLTEYTRPDVKASDLAFLQYTSGSTNKPKGVMLSHGNLIANSDAITKSFKHNVDTWVVSWLPPYHDMGLIGGILNPMYNGNSATLMSPISFLKRPWRWLNAITQVADNYQVTSGAPDFAYDLCARKINEEQYETLDLSRWKVAFTGAEPIREHTLRGFEERFAAKGFEMSRFFPVYGLAEGTLLATAPDPNADPVRTAFDKEALEQHRAQNAVDPINQQVLVACGVAPEGHEARIVNPDTCVECAAGETGEIWLHGPSVAQGYWQNEAVTEETFRASIAGQEGKHYLRTGDLGFYHEGEIYITGRIKDLIIIRGRNHYPQDIESTLTDTIESLREGCGAAFSVEVGEEEQLVIVQELKREFLRKADPEQIIAEINKLVFQVHNIRPVAVVLLEPSSFPKTSSGKVQRRAARQQFLDKTLREIHHWTLITAVNA